MQPHVKSHGWRQKSREFLEFVSTAWSIAFCRDRCLSSGTVEGYLLLASGYHFLGHFELVCEENGIDFVCQLTRGWAVHLNGNLSSDGNHVMFALFRGVSLSWSGCEVACAPHLLGPTPLQAQPESVSRASPEVLSFRSPAGSGESSSAWRRRSDRRRGTGTKP